ncbi:MAG: alpha-mannosidase [Negativicutes bacterium]|jgi:alpha-mannosidase
MMPRTVHVVPHSHWDREWYFTIEDSNVLLVENLDFLIELLETSPDFPAYTFDGQVSVIDEYLKIRPENRERLETLIKNQQLLIGPWYTQTDTLLVGIESIIRNLLYGIRRAKQYGNCMNIGYLPDVFGQNAYLPSLFCDCGLEYSVFQRGVYNDQIKTSLNFFWRSPDDYSIKTNNIYLGYGPGKFIQQDGKYLDEKLRPLLAKLASFEPTDAPLLLPSGGDQMLVRPELPQVVNTLNTHSTDYQFLLSTYEQYLEQAWNKKTDATTITGELIAEEKSRVHHTIGSQRVDIKQKNSALEHKLTHELEPLATIAVQLGLKYPHTWLDSIWTQLFDVHAHDSIGGCNSDETNQTIIDRLDKLSNITDSLLNVLKKQISRAIASTYGKTNILTLFNLAPAKPLAIHNAVVFSSTPDIELKDFAGSTIEFSIINQQQLSGGTVVAVTAAGEQVTAAPDYYRNELLIKTQLPNFGYTALEIIELSCDETMSSKNELSSSQVVRRAATCTIIENTNLALELCAGRLKLTHRASGRIFDNLLIFEDSADAGDSYDYSPLANGRTLLFDQCELITQEIHEHTQILLVKQLLSVPAGLSARTAGDCTISIEVLSTLELRAGEKFLRVSHQLTNSACDHRLRVLLPALSAETSFADQGFSLITRAAENPRLGDWHENKFAEAPVAIYPFQSICGTGDETATFAVFANGLKEYQLLGDERRLALTLFRSVGLLGRDDLLWRPGRASGINNKVVETPDAQLCKPLSFEYALLFDQTSSESELFTEKEHYLNQTLSYQTQTLNSFEERLDRFMLPQPIDSAPHHFSLLELGNDSVFVSALKCGYDNNTIILRLYNPTAIPQTAGLAAPLFSISVTNLTELQTRPFDQLVPARGYVTLRLTHEQEGNNA